ncbi:two-component response regulator [Crocosphaera subtropica ATCC 51142]|uniref:Two-component response regulator n=1 Tax=Crocosphaera subtropica (strain ATCC 51142 / BH68) TaxID=43989 RepID=B1WUN4_CROS5|nr:response regulator transcription factor [Crocosphaera subtropica]ACB50485.1 two-component response regulator [Crocosphaera subtropica ATCC 51142]
MPLLILVADDDLGIRVAVKDYLEMHGYTAITAQNGEDAFSLVQKYRPHLLVSDIKMPYKDGYTLVKELRQLPEFRLLPVVFLTECDTTENRIQGYQVGCDVYLPKPFEMEELKAVIRNLLERSQIIQSEWRFSQEQAQIQKNLQQQQEAAKISIQAEMELLDLTRRESEVLDLLTMGLSNGEIGQRLHLSPRTIEKYVSSLLRKTDTSNRAELVRFALDHHLVS